MELIIPTAEDMIILGEQIGCLARVGEVIYLAGELGMGKTTLVKGIGQGLGCKEMITSPTFTLVNVYNGRMTLYHCDFYRLSGDDAEQLGIKELIGEQGLFAVEWAETIHPDILPAGLNISLELAEDDYEGARRVSFQAESEQANRLLKELMRCRSWQ